MSHSYPSRNKKELLIFDFDGVLADSFDYFYSLISTSMNHVGRSLTRNQFSNFFIGNVHQGSKDFINNDLEYAAFSEFRKNNYDRYYYDENKGVKLFPKVLGFIKEIEKEYILTIASSGKQDNIENLLEKKKIKRYFDLILANSAYTKEGMINKISSKFKPKPENTIMITDTVGDIEVAKKNSLKTIAVTWGFHHKRLLKKSKPDFIANNFKELSTILS